jgi:hypothetical protein
MGIARKAHWSMIRHTETIGAVGIALAFAACSNSETQPGPSDDGSSLVADGTSETSADVGAMLGDAASSGAMLDAADVLSPQAAPDASSASSHCCKQQPADAGLCALPSYESAPTVESCWSSNAAGNFGRWSCSNDAGGVLCSDNGRSCPVGSPCTLNDLGCAGVVVACN